MGDQQPSESAGNGKNKDESIAEVRRATLEHAQIRFWLLLDYMTVLITEAVIFAAFLGLFLALDELVQFVFRDAIAKNQVVQMGFYYFQIGVGIVVLAGYIIHAYFSLYDQFKWTGRMSGEGRVHLS